MGSAHRHSSTECSPTPRLHDGRLNPNPPRTCGLRKRSLQLVLAAEEDASILLFFIKPAMESIVG